jgi:chromosome segregation ATPase
VTLEELLAACEGIVDVSIDVSSRDLDRVLERLRSLDAQQRAVLSNALAAGFDRMRELLRELSPRIEAKEKALAEWREREAISGVDERIASLELDRQALREEAAELEAGIETMRRAIGLVHDAARRDLPGK